MIGERVWEIFLVPGSHLDLGWCGTPGACLARGDRIIRAAMAAIDECNEYRFTVEYALFFKHFWESYPEHREHALDLIRQGKLEVGASWAGPIEQILDCEALVREFTLTREWMASELGIVPATAQLTDTPGHTMQLPQILSSVGVGQMAYSRFHPPVPLHKWRSPDGSQVVAANHPNHYDWGFVLRRGIEEAERRLPGQLAELEAVWPDAPILMGDESDLTPPQPDSCAAVAAWNRAHPEAHVHIATITDFFEAAKPAEHDLPAYEGEMPYGFPLLPAAHAQVYLQARRSESHLVSAEKLSVVRESLGLGGHPREFLNQAWTGLFYCHDHNVGGKHGEVNDRERLNLAVAAFEKADEALSEATSSIAENTKLTRPGAPIVVFNSLSWERSAPVETYVDFHGEPEDVTLTDFAGREIPVQVLSRDVHHERRPDGSRSIAAVRLHITFVAEDVPALGYTTFYAEPRAQAAAYESNVNCTAELIENGHLSLALDNGRPVSMTSNHNGREIIGQDRHFFNEVFALEDIADDIGEQLTGEEWRSSIHPVVADALESGPVRARLRLEGRVLDSPVVQEILCWEGLPWMEFRTTVEWEGKRDVQVRLAYPFNMPDGRKTYEVPFAAVAYPEGEIEGTYKGSGSRIMGKWADVSASDFGVTLACQLGNINLPTDRPTLYPVMLRSSYSCGDAFLRYQQGGTTTFGYSLLPHEGDWADSNAFRHGWEYNTPLLTALIPMPALASHERGLHDWSFHLPSPPFGTLPERMSFLSVSDDGVVVSAVAKPAHGEGFIVRLFEVKGREGIVDLDFMSPVAEAEEVDLAERRLGSLDFTGSRVSLPVKPHGIHTIRVHLV